MAECPWCEEGYDPSPVSEQDPWDAGFFVHIYIDHPEIHEAMDKMHKDLPFKSYPATNPRWKKEKT